MNNIIHLICKVNADDNFSTALKALEVNLSNKKNYHYTFGDTTRKHNSDLKLLPQPFSNEGLDLLYLSLFVYFADRRFQMLGLEISNCIFPFCQRNGKSKRN